MMLKLATRSLPPRHRLSARRGSVLLLTIIFLLLFTALAVAFNAASDMNLRQAHNYQNAQNAQLAAESGLGYLLSLLAYVTVPASEAESDLLLAVANDLATEIDGTANVGVGEITLANDTIYIPGILSGPNGRAFNAEITEVGGGRLLLTVRGGWLGASRKVQIQLQPEITSSPVFDFGIASQGKILLGGDGSVLGVNNPAEAGILSATYSNPEAILVSGSCQIDGDLYTSNPDSYVKVTGSPTVGG
ncbi:MAG: hypothetical protein HQ546_09010, partial [Planctomycetes bacterium]|nr:hypothetical protein [Planctomycetota bacterium]